ncbi:hypothetical protein KAJ02_01405 [Candidatus Bipolaricaulota bacterium]|jgi:cell division protein FtsL|nr:hypothetical protein [Candidatus Bipolaricaulota bacterium]
MSMLGLLGGILLAGAISGLCFLYLWQGNRIQELTAASEEAREQLEAAQEINRILGVRIEAAFSLERIARIAREQLGMSEPEPTEIRYVPLSIDESD